MPTLDELQLWAAQGESRTQEFKLTTGQRRESGMTLCAMLNGAGGRVLFGVNDSGSLVGQQVSDTTVRDLVHVYTEIDPPASPQIDAVELTEQKSVIVVQTPRGPRPPHTFAGKAYKRVGSSTVEMTADEYNQMLAEQLHGTDRWENRPAPNWTVDDLDGQEIIKTVEAAVSNGRLADPGTRDLSELLLGLNLRREEELLQAAVVLFGRSDRVLPDYPQCLLRVARFGRPGDATFRDNRQFHGHAFELLQRAQNFVLERIPVISRLYAESLERVDEPLYPPLALREALANAFCHRDYSIGGGSVSVALYDERLELTSSGPLHFGITAESLYGPHESIPWNPLIARVFYLRGLIEQWGMGTLRMIEQTDRAGLPRPEIRAGGASVMVIFQAGTGGVGLTEAQAAVIRVLRQGRAPMALSAIEAQLGDETRLTRRGLQDVLQSLKRRSLVSSAGRGRSARWSLTR